jgi:hypothetical protein
MTDDELIFLGAAILLAPMIHNNRDPDITKEVSLAANHAIALREEVKQLLKKPQHYGLTELLTKQMEQPEP